VTNSSPGSPRMRRINPALRRLGLSQKDRAVVIHADDIGMCQATVPAIGELLDFGIVSSAAVMVPCPWFPAAADWARANPACDVGVHLTLTSEWRHYRWRPVSTLDPRSGLLDCEGFLPRMEQPSDRARPDAVSAETRAQLTRARQFGIDPSHLDSHMFTLRRHFLREYFELVFESGLPALIDRDDVDRWRASGGDALRLARADIPVFDHIASATNDGAPEDRVSTLKAMFDDLPSGLSCFLLHPAQDTPELRAIVPNWKNRVADYTAFLDAGLKAHLRSAGIEIVTYRSLRPRTPTAATG
jgi:chitin disaccharide deacetylase